jgi:PKHD-type hydroxylase
MRSEWCYFKEYFSASKCQEIIDMALKLPAEDPVIGADGEFKVDTTIRKSQIRWIRRRGEWLDLFSEIDRLVARANDEHFFVSYNYCNAFQFTEYDESYQGEYKVHKDTFLTFPGPHRKLSLSVQLSDPASYEGGDFEFTDVGQSPNPVNIRTQGTTIVFPSISYHLVKPVTKGTRYSLVGWYEGPQWR